jgi:predicted ribosome quality control (RQC) complex YloA/Tae2 family protein
MEANFFRHLAREAGEALKGRRIEKIHSPADNVWTVRLDGPLATRHLLFRPAKHAGLLFFSDQKPANPLTPPARVMWLRKRIQGRRITAWHAHWPSLRIALELTPSRRDGAARYLLLDLRTGLRLTDELPDNFDETPDWPELREVLQSKDVWRRYPQISPPLRKRLHALEGDEAAALYARVRNGDIPERLYVPQQPDGPGLPLVWPSPGQNLTFNSALDAASAWGLPTLFPDLEEQAERPEQVLLRRRRKKTLRALAKLDQEKERLEGLLALREHGEAIKANMHLLSRYDGESERLPETMRLPHPNLGPLDIAMDPALSASANMERCFRMADKGQRGFTHLARRRNELGRELARIESGQGSAFTARPGADSPEAKPAPLPKRWKGLAVHLFTTSDGFTVARGKNKKANHEMLSKAASPFDYWFHAADGPSSHVILKRDYPDQNVPLQSLQEAAALCALKSAFKKDGRVEVMFALVKDVRKVKGWAHGQVSVQQVQGTVAARPDPDLETRLARSE